jgi:hypothetical protein
VPSHPHFLFPVKALGEVFRGKFLDVLRQPQTQQNLIWRQETQELETTQGFQRLVDQLYAKDWVVYAKRPFAGPQQVLEYIGRYTHRVAISNNRIVDVRAGRVRFTYRNRRQGDRLQTLEIAADVFIQRFLLHLLPAGFVRIRYCGLLANRCKAQALRQCRQVLGHEPVSPTPEPKTVAQWMQQWTGIDITRCPQCGHQPLRKTAVPVGGGTVMPRAP